MVTLESTSPINTERLTGQNLRLYNYLLAGKKIHCFSRAKRKLRIGFLNSRTSELIHKHGIVIKKRRTHALDLDGERVSVVEYSL